MLLLTEGITLRNKSIPLHSQNPYYQKDEWLTTTVRVENIPLSADDEGADQETTTADDDENTNYEEIQQPETLTENDKKRGY
ncbi:Hypothetical predicted protein [Mytilus galloprovincialis]|uniref:Uncharacterized protein n=1 Tax=Mytilus galloprovincialis TaxID=29158 RepID=A0A8B6GFV8_MYTGA|nr:Hypothetical predicted protein [Mytilus galloprovincialis]